jgi:hypothetical protein
MVAYKMEKTEMSTDKPLRLIAGINVAVLVAYIIYFRFVDHGQYNIIGVAFLIAIQVALCLILAIFTYHKEFLLSAALVLLIGFSTCWLAFGR